MRSTLSQKIGFALSVLISLFLIVGSLVGKFGDWEGKAQMFEKMGLTVDLVKKIGVVEIIIALLYVAPRTSFLGTILLTGYMGGAILTHARVGDPFVAQIIIGVVIWIAQALRQPQIFRLAFGGHSPSAPSDGAASGGST